MEKAAEGVDGEREEPIEGRAGEEGNVNTICPPIDEVTERAGFGWTEFLRTHFRRRLDTTPTRIDATSGPMPMRTRREGAAKPDHR